MWQYRWWGWLLVLLIALLVQTALLPQIFPMGYVPDLVLVVVVAFAFFETPVRGAILGALAGLLVDIVAGRFIGLNMVVDAMAGCLVASVQSKIIRDDVFVPGLVGAVFEGASRVAQWIILAIFGYRFGLLGFMASLPIFVLFGLFMTPAIIALLHLRPRHEVDVKLQF